MSMLISASSIMNRAYAGNVYFKDKNFRKNSANHDTVSADRKAMVRALERLNDLDFESEEPKDTKSVYNTVTSYLDIYNNAVDSATSSNSSDIRRTGKNMKALMKKYESSLGEIGIRLKSNGTVEVDKTKLKKAAGSKVSRVFGDSDYLTEMNTLMKKLRNQVNREPSVQTVQTKKKTDESLSTETAGGSLNLYV